MTGAEPTVELLLIFHVWFLIRLTREAMPVNEAFHFKPTLFYGFKKPRIFYLKLYHVETLFKSFIATRKCYNVVIRNF